MKKRFDVKGTLSVPARELTPEHIEMATRQIHEKSEAAKADKPAASSQNEPQKPAEKPKIEKQPKVAAPKKPQVSTAVLPALSALRPVLPPRSEREPELPRRVLGRIGRRIVTDDPAKKVRLSVDVRPDVHKKLKIKAIENDSDIMRYVERLIEKDLGIAGA